MGAQEEEKKSKIVCREEENEKGIEEGREEERGEREV